MPRKNPPLPPKAELRLGRGVLRDYRPSIVRTFKERDVRLEYRRLYRIYQHRMKRLEASRFKNFAAEQRDRFKPISQLAYADVRSTILDLARWVQNREFFSVTGQEEIRARQLETLRGVNADYAHITDENFDEFGEFMRFYRDSKLDELYDSDAAVDAFNIQQALDISPGRVIAEFEKWLKNIESLKSIFETHERASPNWETVTADEINQFLRS